MKRQRVQRKVGSKRGVALIVVLGFLTIMILMALAFLTQARTERLVANSTLEAQRGRQFVRTALTAAMNDYSVELWGQQYLLPPTNTPTGDDLTVFPSLPPTFLTDISQTLGASNIRLLAGEARRWIPRRYLTQAVTNLVADAEWILVRENPAQLSRILGRYAYVCFDMSGGIDANLVALTSGVAKDGIKTNWPAKPVARSSVRDVGMGELAETVNASTFKTLRKGWHGFDNMAELILLTNGKYNGGEQQYEDEDDETKAWGPPGSPRWQGDRVEYSAALNSSKVSDLVPYSLAAYRGIYDIAGATWEAPQVCDATADWTKVLQPVAGQLAGPANTVKAIQDYLDADSAPQGIPDYPSSEAVPMFSELGLTLELEYLAATTQLVLNVDLTFETWYPFPSDDNEPSGTSYSIKAPTIGGGLPVSGPGDIWIRCALLGGQQVDLQTATPSVPELTFPADVNGGVPQAQGTIQYAIPLKPVSTSLVVTAANQLLVQFARTQQPILMEQGANNPVDQMMFDAAGLNKALVVDTPYSRYLEVDDPRLNHDKDRWTLLAPGSGGTTMNGEAQAAGYGAPGGEGLYMYCRNEAMKSPAELGFISTGNPWETIDLCTEEGAEMMSKLVADQAIVDAINSSTNNNTFYTNGTINPNTSSTNVLMAAFTGLKVAEVPNVSQSTIQSLVDGSDQKKALTNELLQAEAGDLAGSMVFESKTKKIAATDGAFMSGSAWARVPAMEKGGLLAQKGLNKNQRESLIRNTWGLFSPNNSLFTVLVIGQAIKEGPGPVGLWDPNTDIITGERRGVALVWRDPFPSTGGFHHEMFVRMFKFLDE
jgi:hypothetical protein